MCFYSFPVHLKDRHSFQDLFLSLKIQHSNTLQCCSHDFTVHVRRDKFGSYTSSYMHDMKNCEMKGVQPVQGIGRQNAVLEGLKVWTVIILENLSVVNLETITVLVREMVWRNTELHQLTKEKGNPPLLPDVFLSPSHPPLVTANLCNSKVSEIWYANTA